MALVLVPLVCTYTLILEFLEYNLLEVTRVSTSNFSIQHLFSSVNIEKRFVHFIAFLRFVFSA